MINAAKLFEFKKEIFAGIVTGLVVIPEAMLFSYITGLEPIIGLISYIVICLIVGIGGGKAGMISGPEKISAFIIATIIADYGISYLPIITVSTGIIILLVGVLKFGKFIRLLSKPVLLGFINGAGVAIVLTQLSFFKYSSQEILTFNFLYQFILPLIATLVVFYILQKRNNPFSFLITLAIGFALSALNTTYSYTPSTFLFSQYNSVQDFMPFYYLDEFYISPRIVISLFPKLLIITLILLVNSLTSLAFFDEITSEETRGNADKECIALGIANITSGILGYLPGTCMFGKSVLNIHQGATKNISAILSVFIVLLATIGFQFTYTGFPIIASVAVMLGVFAITFNWTSFRYIKQIPQSDAFLMISVTAISILTNAFIAITFGIVLSSLIFAWENAKRIRTRTKIDKDGVKHYEVYGPLFFASSDLFQMKFTAQNDPENIIINFSESRIWDDTGIEALNNVCLSYLELGKNVTVSFLSFESRKLLRKNISSSQLHFITNEDDPTYKVVTELHN